jgi:hypothetical protein
VSFESLSLDEETGWFLIAAAVVRMAKGGI